MGHFLFLAAVYLFSTIKHTTTYLGDNPHVGLLSWGGANVIAQVTSTFHFQVVQEISLIVGIVIGVTTIYGFLKKEGLFKFLKRVLKRRK